MILNKININIIKEFLGDYSAKFTGSYLAKKNNLNQKSVANFLNSLESEGFLISKTEGRNKLFSLNLDNPQLVHLISMVEHYRTNGFYSKNPLIREVSEKVKEISEGIVIIFGSYAKERHKKDSDLDIFIVGQYDENNLNEIEDMYKIDINVKYYPLNIFKKSLKKNDPLIEEVIKHHIILKGVQNFVNYLKVHYGKD